MKILMQNRYDATKNIGGDTIQMIQTKEHLERMGVEVDISLELEPDLSGYDIVHLFNITRIHETWLQYKNAKRQNKKIVISTIHHKKSEIDRYEKLALKKIAKIIKRIFVKEDRIQLIKTIFYTIQSKSPLKGVISQYKEGFFRQQKQVIEGVECILPNSNMEYEAILEDFNISELKYEVIVNGVDVSNIVEDIDEELFIQKYNIRDFIFCAGRIEPRKNQLAIIEAMKESDLPIVFAGAINYKHKSYYKEFLKLVEENEKIVYVGLLSRTEIFSAYKLAKVNVLASWFETTGLVGLEAALMNCNLVITEKGYTREYYEDNVWYCNPENIESIRRSINKAYSKKFNGERFKQSILDKYTWQNAAIQTKKAYERVLRDET